jgi:hypothetical protein
MMKMTGTIEQLGTGALLSSSQFGDRGRRTFLAFLVDPSITSEFTMYTPSMTHPTSKTLKSVPFHMLECDGYTARRGPTRHRFLVPDWSPSVTFDPPAYLGQDGVG